MSGVFFATRPLLASKNYGKRRAERPCGLRCAADGLFLPSFVGTTRWLHLHWCSGVLHIIAFTPLHFLHTTRSPFIRSRFLTDFVKTFSKSPHCEKRFQACFGLFAHLACKIHLPCSARKCPPDIGDWCPLAIVAPTVVGLTLIPCVVVAVDGRAQTSRAPPPCT